jgi:hypothetical protein
MSINSWSKDVWFSSKTSKRATSPAVWHRTYPFDWFFLFGYVWVLESWLVIYFEMSIFVSLKFSVEELLELCFIKVEAWDLIISSAI